jgi:hypothetical protein
LLPGEGANAFRINVEDAKGRQYRFPVLDISAVKGQKDVYALTVQLTDELGFWERPKFKGDVLVSVAWRGLVSNRARLAIGKTGGTIKDDAGAVSTAAPQTPTDKFENTPGPEYVGYYYSADRIRFLEQATFGPTFTLDQKIRRSGLRSWLNTQLEAPYPTFPYPNILLKETNTDTGCPCRIHKLYSRFLHDVSGADLVLQGSLLRRRAIKASDCLGIESALGSFRR